MHASGVMVTRMHINANSQTGAEFDYERISFWPHWMHCVHHYSVCAVYFDCAGWEWNQEYRVVFLHVFFLVQQKIIKLYVLHRRKYNIQINRLPFACCSMSIFHQRLTHHFATFSICIPALIFNYQFHFSNLYFNYTTFITKCFFFCLF